MVLISVRGIPIAAVIAMIPCIVHGNHEKLEGEFTKERTEASELKSVLAIRSKLVAGQVLFARVDGPDHWRVV